MHIKKFFLLFIICILGLNMIYAADDNSTQEDVANSVENLVTDTYLDADSSGNIQTNNIHKQENSNIKKDSKTVILNSTTFDTYVTDKVFNDNIEEGDTIDIQGLLYNSRFSLQINKPVNVISSTHDSYITSGEFGIIEGGSGSNITGISIHNTPVYTSNAKDVVIDNISVISQDIDIGSGTGHFSIRDSSNITVTNSYFETKNTGGHSNVVCYNAENCTFENNTIVGHGYVGNLFYITTFGSSPSDTGEVVTYTNKNITLRNNYIDGRDCGGSICYMLALTGANHLIENNTVISYIGASVMKQFSLSDRGVYNITFNNNLLASVQSELLNNENLTFNNNTILSYDSIRINDTTYQDYGYIDEDTFYLNTTVDAPVYINLKNISKVTLLYDVDLKYVQDNVKNIDINTDTFNIKYLHAPNAVINCTGIGNLSYSTIKSIITNNAEVNINHNNIVNNDSANITEGLLQDHAIILNNADYNTNCSDNYIIRNNTKKIVGKNAIYTDNSNAILNNNSPLKDVNITVTTNTTKYNITIDNYNKEKIIDILTPGKSYEVTVNITSDEEAVDNGYALMLLNGIPVANYTLDNGVVRTNLTIEKITQNDLRIWYMSDNDFSNNITKKEIQLYRLNTTITLESESVKIGEDININATLIDEDNETVTNGILTFIVNNTEHDITINNGTGSFKSKTNDSWLNGVYAIFYETDEYNKVQTSVIKLSKGEVIFNIKQEIEGENDKITVYLTDVGGSPITSGYVRFKDGSKTIKTVKIVDGIAECEIPLVNITEGQTIIANLTNNNAFNLRAENITLTLNPPTITNINIDEIIGKTNEETTITAQVSASNDNIINEGTVTFTTTDYNETVNVVNGTATTTHIFTQAINDTLTATFNPTNTTNYYESSNTTSIIIVKEPVNVIININPIESKVDEETIIMANITSTSGTPVNSGTVIFSTSDYNETVTLTDGVAITTHIFTQEINDTLTVSYTSDNDDYNNKTTTTTITVLNDDNYILKVDTSNFTIGENALIQATIYLNNKTAESITKGKVIFKVNGKTLKDSNNKIIYAKIVNGTAKIENYTIPTSWNKENITIEAVYSGSNQLSSLRSDKKYMNISKEEAKITTQDIITTKASTITLTANINDGSKVISTGKVVFKINGKTVKDAKGKVIYVQVTNNTAILEYTLPLTYKAKDYTITATFLATGYDKLVDTKTLTIQ